MVLFRSERVEVLVSEKEILFRARATGPWDAERAMFETKSDMLALAAKRPVTCEPLP